MTARPAAECGPSLRLVIAASRLRDGENPERVAQATKVPIRLVRLIAEELDHCEQRPIHAGTTIRSGASRGPAHR